MQVVIDVGNTNIVFGFFDSERARFRMRASHRISTPKVITTDELSSTFKNILLSNRLQEEDLTEGIFASVVPELNHNITKMMNNHFNINIHPVTKGLFCDLRLNYSDSESIGVDRLVNLKAASVLYGSPNIVIDFGTAVTIDVMSAEREFLGGMIMPGIAISLEALVKNTSKLPMIELEYPKKILGNSTKECMQYGMFYSSSLGIRGIVDLIGREYFADQKPEIVATGGLSRYVTHAFEKSIHLEPNLALIGLKILLDAHLDEGSK